MVKLLHNAMNAYSILLPSLTNKVLKYTAFFISMHLGEDERNQLDKKSLPV